jgi:pimeloyl-ACP methyl ester carboxylesterase
MEERTDLTTIALTLVLIVIAATAGGLAYGRIRTRHLAQMAESLVPPSGKFLEIDGDRFHYVEQGAGEAILFVHGMGGNLRHFDVPLWPAMGGGYRLIAVDRLGSGYSKPAAGHSGLVSDHAADMARFLDHLGIGKALIVGHSLGGAIALAMAVNHPDEVAGLALLAPLTRYNPKVPKEFAGLDLGRPWMRRFAADYFAIPLSVRAARETLAFVFGPQEPPEDFAVAGGALVGLLPSHFYGASTDFVAIRRDLPGLQERWEGNDVPTGILFGTEDRVVDCGANGVAMKERFDAIDLQLLEGVGHMPQYARPEETAAFIRRIAERAFAS